MCERTAPTYASLLSRNAWLTSCDFFHGFRVTEHRRVRDNLYLDSSFSLRPSTASLRHRPFTREPPHTASAAAALSLARASSSLRLSLSTDSAPALAIAAAPTAALSLTAVLSTAAASASAELTAERFTAAAELTTERSAASLCGTFLVTRALALGLCAGSRGCELIAEASLRPGKALHLFASAAQLSAGVRTSVAPRTDVGAAVTVSCADLSSSLAVGLRRAFRMSALHVTADTRGVVKAAYSFRVRDGIVLCASSYADHANAVYSIGVGAELTA